MRFKSLQDLPIACRKNNPALFGDNPTQTPNPMPSTEKPRKRIRQDTKPLLNKLETEFGQYLHAFYPSNSIIPQSIRFRLGNGIWYKPDYVMISTDGVQAYEVKGPHAFRGGFENLKVAASLYPSISWVLVWKENCAWQNQAILP